MTQDFFPKIGGAHLWLYEVYKRWPRQVAVLTQDYGCDVNLIGPQREFDSMNHGNIKIFRENLESEDINIFNVKYIKQLFEVLRFIRNISNSRTMALHALRAFPEGVWALAFQASCRRVCKLITYAHGEEVLIAKTSHQLLLLTKLVLRKSNLIIANSRSTKNIIKEIVPNANVAVVHPGVDINRFYVPKMQCDTFKKKQGYHYPIILFSIARMEARKNHAMVIRAVAQLLKEGLPIGYLIAGTGEENNKLHNLVAELGLSSYVRFLGKIPEKEKPLYFASSDIHVMPSIQCGPMIEGFGIVFLEAAATGTPSIAGNVGGQKEAVLHGQTGLVVDGNNINELEKAIRYLAKNKKIRRRMGERAKKWAQQHDWNNVTKKIMVALNSIGYR